MSSGGEWSDDAVGRGILGQREKGVSSFFSFIHVCDCESLRCDAERVCAFLSSPFLFLQRPVLMSPDPCR